MERTAAKQQPNIASRKDVYAIVTERIIQQLEKGTVPWRQPWTDAGIPRNLISKRPYRGINVMLLSMLGYEQNLFLTFNQVQELGGHVRKGEHGHIVVFWSYLDAAQKGREEAETETGKRKVPYLRYYMVFNVGQCEGIPQGKVPAITRATLSPIPVCEQIVQEMPMRPLVRHTGGQGAFYDAMHDYVNMPLFNSFESAEGYYAILMHELVHSTGHGSRVGRKDLFKMAEFNTLEAYSHEELVAEIGSCYLLSFAGITNRIAQSADYIKGWLSELKSDTKFIFSAATQAQKATDFILNLPAEVIEEQTQKPKPGIRRAFTL